LGPEDDMVATCSKISCCAGNLHQSIWDDGASGWHLFFRGIREKDVTFVETIQNKILFEKRF
jgi:hypothetical protein